jgi:hypothetical protein
MHHFENLINRTRYFNIIRPPTGIFWKILIIKLLVILARPTVLELVNAEYALYFDT